MKFILEITDKPGWNIQVKAMMPEVPVGIHVQQEVRADLVDVRFQLPPNIVEAIKGERNG